MQNANAQMKWGTIACILQYDLGMLAMFAGEKGARKKSVVQSIEEQEGAAGSTNETEGNSNRA